MVAGELEPIPDYVRLEAGCSQPITEPTHKDKQPITLTFTPTDNLESPSKPKPSLPVSGLWEEAGVPEENQHRHKENTQTPPG